MAYINMVTAKATEAGCYCSGSSAVLSLGGKQETLVTTRVRSHFISDTEQFVFSIVCFIICESGQVTQQHQHG